MAETGAYVIGGKEQLAADVTRIAEELVPRGHTSGEISEVLSSLIRNVSPTNGQEISIGDLARSVPLLTEKMPDGNVVDYLINLTKACKDYSGAALRALSPVLEAGLSPAQLSDALSSIMASDWKGRFSDLGEVYRFLPLLAAESKGKISSGELTELIKRTSEIYGSGMLEPLTIINLGIEKGLPPVQILELLSYDSVRSELSAKRSYWTMPIQGMLVAGASPRQINTLISGIKPFIRQYNGNGDRSTVSNSICQALEAGEGYFSLDQIVELATSIAETRGEERFSAFRSLPGAVKELKLAVSPEEAIPVLIKHCGTFGDMESESWPVMALALRVGMTDERAKALVMSAIKWSTGPELGLRVLAGLIVDTSLSTTGRNFNEQEISAIAESLENQNVRVLENLRAAARRL